MNLRTRSLLPAALWQVGFFTLLLWPSGAWAAEFPLEVVRTTTAQALAVLQDGSAQGQERIERIWQTVLPRFDTREIAQRSLGVHWNDLTEEQRQNFVNMFVQLLKKNYSGTVARYAKDAQFFYDGERLDGDFAEVQTRILSSSQNTCFSISYRLHRRAGKWLVYDVVAENVGMVRNYRNQFNRIIDKSSYEGLVQALGKKIQELEISPS